MKSLPEDEMMSALRKRLTDYTEEPDDDAWDKIAPALPKASTHGIKTTMFVLLFLLYTSLMWFAGSYYGKTDLIPPEEKASTLKNVAITEEDSCKIPIEQVKTKTKSSDLAESSSAITNPALTNVIIHNEGAQIKKSSLTNQSTDNNDADFTTANPGIEPTGLEVYNRASEFSITTDTSVAPKDSIPVSKKVSEKINSDQKESKKVKNFKPVLYASFTPSLAYQRINPFRQDEVMITRLNSKGIFSADRIGVSADIGLQWQLSNTLTLYSGLLYYQQNSTISYRYQSGQVKSVQPSNGQFNYVLTPVTSDHQLNYKMKNAGLSAGILYLLQGIKLKHYVGVGMQYQIGMMKQNDDQTYTNRGSSYLNYQVLYRMEFIMNRKYRLFIQPNYTHVLQSNEKLHEPFKIEPYRAGVGFGCVYYFD